MKIASATFVKGTIGEDQVLYDKYPQIAFVGRSNVGKSSVINSLVGDNRDLVKTGKKPGKTTEINFFKVNDKYYFVDLPGYGFAKMGQEGRERIREMILNYIANPKIPPHTVAIILDAKAGLTDFDRDMLDILRDNGHRMIIILNKTDKLNQKELSQTLASITAETPPDVTVFPYSALTQKTVKQLRELLIAKK